MKWIAIILNAMLLAGVGWTLAMEGAPQGQGMLTAVFFIATPIVNTVAILRAGNLTRMTVDGNERRKLALLVVVVIMVLMLLFPPFHIFLGEGVVQNLGYGLIFSPPVHESEWGQPRSGSVDIAMLFTQWIAVLVIGWIIYVISRPKH